MAARAHTVWITSGMLTHDVMEAMVTLWKIQPYWLAFSVTHDPVTGHFTTVHYFNEPRTSMRAKIDVWIGLGCRVYRHFFFYSPDEVVRTSTSDLQHKVYDLCG